MEHKVIAKFINDNKEYYILETNKKIVNYAIVENEKVITNFCQNDLELFNYIVKSLKVNNKTSINMGTNTIEGQKFKIFYDLKNKLHYWYKIIDNKLVEANYEENCRLNFRYNNLPLVLYTEDDEIKRNKKQDNNFIQRIVTLGKKTIVVLVAAGLSLTNFKSCKIGQEIGTYTEKESLGQGIIENSFIGNIFATDKEKRLYRDYDYSEVQDAISNNKNLTDEEKEFLYKLRFVFDENHQYMNMDEVLKRLNKLKIIYKEESSGAEAGSFSHAEDRIILYETKDFSEANLACFIHEFLHCLQEYTNTMNRFTVELSDELLTEEVLRRLNEENLIDNKEEYVNQYGECTQYGRGYNNFMFFEYYLAELLPKDKMQDYQFWPDEETIVTELLKIEGLSQIEIEEKISQKKKFEKEGQEDGISQEVVRAYKLLDDIDSFREYSEEKKGYFPNVELGQYLKTYCDIYAQMDYYHIRKYGKTMAENPAIGLKDFDLYSNIKTGEYTIDNTFRFIKNRWITISSVSEAEVPELFYTEREEAFSDTIVELADINFGDECENETIKNFEEKNFSKEIYYLPRTYFSDTHPYAMVYLNPEKCTNSVLELNESVKEKFENNFKAKKIEKLANDERIYVGSNVIIRKLTDEEEEALNKELKKESCEDER